jgi:hypothetical protein
MTTWSGPQAEDKNGCFADAWNFPAGGIPIEVIMIHCNVDFVDVDLEMALGGGPLLRAVQRNLPRPLQGAARIAAFVAATTTGGENTLEIEEHEINGRPAIVFWTADRPFAAMLLAVADGKIQRVFFHADLSRLRYLGRRSVAPRASSTWRRTRRRDGYWSLQIDSTFAIGLHLASASSRPFSSPSAARRRARAA